MDDLLAAGLLLEHEAHALQQLSCKPAVVWAWLTHFWTRALRGELNTTRIMHADQLAPLVLAKCMQGRSAVGLTLAYTDTKQYALEPLFFGGVGWRSRGACGEG